MHPRRGKGPSETIAVRSRSHDVDSRRGIGDEGHAGNTLPHVETAVGNGRASVLLAAGSAVAGKRRGFGGQDGASSNERGSTVAAGSGAVDKNRIIGDNRSASSKERGSTATGFANGVNADKASWKVNVAPIADLSSCGDNGPFKLPSSRDGVGGDKEDSDGSFDDVSIEDDENAPVSSRIAGVIRNSALGQVYASKAGSRLLERQLMAVETHIQRMLDKSTDPPAQLCDYDNIDDDDDNDGTQSISEIVASRLRRSSLGKTYATQATSYMLERQLAAIEAHIKRILDGRPAAARGRAGKGEKRTGDPAPGGRRHSAPEVQRLPVPPVEFTFDSGEVQRLPVPTRASGGVSRPRRARGVSPAPSGSDRSDRSGRRGSL